MEKSMKKGAVAWLRNAGLSLIAALALPTAAFAGGGEVRFAADGHAETPAWSADGKYLVFEVNSYGENNISMFYSAVTGQVAKDAVQVKLVGGTGGFNASKQILVNATWHPSQPALIFEGSNDSGDTRLYLQSPGGPAPSEFITQAQLKGKLSFPQFSADGMKLAFISSATGDGDIYARDNNTAKISQLTKSDGTEVFPQYSKDGKSLVFTRKMNGGEDVIEVDLGTNAEKDVASGNGDQTRPAYAAGGAIVYFTNERGSANNWDLGVVDAAGKRIIAKDVRLPTRARPAVSPDGLWVAYTSADPTKANKVSLSKIDGTKTVDVPSSFTACGDPAIGFQKNAGATRIILAYTYLPQAGADWRHLGVEDITDKLQ
jgi:Tol biopolymer transport system component